jgi:lysophospholipase L1-like esterase
MPTRTTAILRVLHAAALLCVVALPSAHADDAPPESAFEPEIRAFEESDRKAPPPQGAVLFVGSSSIRMWSTLAEDFPGTPIVNRGFGGSQIADSIRFAGRIVLPHKPRHVLLYAGDNDVASGKSPEQVLADFRAFVETIHAALPEARITYIAIKPSVARWALVDKIREANRLVREFCERDDGADKAGDNEGGAGQDLLGYADVFTPMLGPDGKPRPELLLDDGLHLTREGYKVWAEVIRPLLQPRSGGRQ